MEKLLSIIIPTYNMEKYLRRCLSSLLIKDNQENLEVIVVNDGSKDKSSEIAHEYENNFPQIYRVIDKKNGNYGSCINCGLKEASGKYFRILDADDFFNTDSLIKLINYINELHEYPDIILTNYQEDYGLKKKKVLKAKYIEYNKIYHQKDLDFRRQPVCVMHGTTYRTEILKLTNLRHQEGISYTDSEYCFYPLSKVKTVVFLDLILYRYQIGREGQTVSNKSYMKNIRQVFMIIDRMLCYLESNKNNNPAYVYNNQKKILINSLKVYYSTILTNSFCHSEDLLSMENRIKMLDEFLYNEIGKITCLKIPVVKIWRKTGIDANNIIYNYFFEILKYFKSRF